MLLTGLFVLGFLAYRTYAAQPPIPERTVAEDGRILFTRADVADGQELFLRRGLMEHGSIFGHGAYLGPDFTADALRQSALAARAYYERRHDPNPGERTATDFKRNRYDASNDVLVLSDAQAAAFGETQAHYAAYFAAPAKQTGLRFSRAICCSSEEGCSRCSGCAGAGCATASPSC